jgi:hypothetical protein
MPRPKAWTAKDNKQYDDIKKSEMQDGESEDEAQELAARIVNKRRREEGRTPNVRTQGTGNPNLRLEQRPRDEIYNRAKELKIKGRSTMTKAELVEAVRQRQSHSSAA